MAITTVTDTTFEAEVLKSDKPTLVDFWAEWCGPCKQMNPILEKLAEEYGSIKITKLNVDENQETPAKHGVRSIPTLILFKDGQVEATSVGAQPEAKLVEIFKLDSLKN